ncbi:MAG: cytochrome c maturation protein CcmE [Bacteroidota bacterium]|jgi:cytochrome c-type biogenesis protein CcmE
MKKTHIIGIVLIALSIGAILSTFSESSTYASFNEALEEPEREFHVVGKLNKKKEMIYSPEKNANLFSFYLTDREGTEKKVLFNGAKPQDFERSEQVVIVGEIEGEIFNANKILMKCPSKYNDGKMEESSYDAKSKISLNNQIN